MPKAAATSREKRRQARGPCRTVLAGAAIRMELLEGEREAEAL